MKRPTAFILFVTALVASSSHANVTYTSISNAVASVEGNARIALNAGVYETRTGGTQVTWTLPRQINARMSFQYADGTLQQGVIDFGTDAKTYVLFRNDAGLCARFLLRRITVKDGFVDPDPKKTTITTADGPECTKHYSSFQHAVGRVFSPQRTASRLFSGDPFSSLEKMCAKGNTKCGDAASSRTAGPVSYIEFNTFVPKSGQPQPALRVALRAKETIQLPNGAGAITLAEGSGFDLQSAVYDVPSQTGSAVIRKIRFAVDSGNLIFGETFLKLPAGGLLEFANLDIDRLSDQTVLRNGSFAGELGPGSNLKLTNSGGNDSYVVIKSAKATLSGLALNFKGKTGSLSGVSGQIFAEVDTVQLQTGNGLRVSAVPKIAGETIRVDLNLVCPPGASAECRPFVWGQDGRTSIKGTLSPFEAVVQKGGTLAMYGKSKLEIDSGSISTKSLTIDTDKMGRPMVGKDIRFQLRLSAQDWVIDKSLKLKAAAFAAQSTNFELDADEDVPIGDLDLKLTVTELSAAGIGQVTFASASADLTVRISHSRGTPPTLQNGEFVGTLAATGKPGNSGSLRIRVHDLQLTQDSAIAKFDFSLNSLEGLEVISEFEQKLAGVEGGRFKINVEKVSVGYRLIEPIVFKNAAIELKNGKWTLSNILDIPIKLIANFIPADPELFIARAQHELGNSNIGYAQTSCKPEAQAVNKSYQVSGSVDLTFEEKNGKTIKKAVGKNFKLEPQVEVNINKSNCNAVAFVQCQLLGGLLTGNPIAALAAGLACNMAIDDQKQKLQDDAATKASDFITEFNKEVTFD